VPPTRALRRFVLAAALACGLGLVGVATTGVARMDAALQDAERAVPQERLVRDAPGGSCDPRHGPRDDRAADVKL
jgi:hypothetical protein